MEFESGAQFKMKEDVKLEVLVHEIIEKLVELKIRYDALQAINDRNVRVIVNMTQERQEIMNDREAAAILKGIRRRATDSTSEFKHEPKAEG